jgi:hypothetical protein
MGRMMRRAPWAAACLVLLAVIAHAEGQRVNVVTEQVRGVPTVDAPEETSTLLVYVVDDAGDPIDEVEVVVLSAGKQVGSGRSDGRGRVLLTLSAAGPVRVRASEAGFITSAANSVVLRHGGLTALVLPLEEAPITKLKDEPDDEPKAKPAPKNAPSAPSSPAGTAPSAAAAAGDQSQPAKAAAAPTPKPAPAAPPTPTPTPKPASKPQPNGGPTP